MSASGAMQSNGQLRNQVNGIPIVSDNSGPLMKALADVKKQTGGLVNMSALANTNAFPVRIQVCYLVTLADLVLDSYTDTWKC